MLIARPRNVIAAWVLMALVAGARAEATSIYEPNNTAIKAAVLTAGQFTVQDDLNGASGRAATLLGAYDPEFKTLSASAAAVVGVGNGFGSQLTGIALRPNGSAYFRVTGAGDTTFTGDHSQVGRYSVEFKIFNAAHQLVETKPLKFDNVDVHMIDNIWLNPQTAGDPNRIGGTVDVTVNNIVGPGTADSLDFFVFSGMLPFQSFSAMMPGAGFQPLMGLFTNAGALLSESNPLAVVPILTGKADSQGRALIGVSGAVDSLFKGEHIAVGAYTLVVTPVAVPEPASSVLLCLGAAGAAFLWRRRHR